MVARGLYCATCHQEHQGVGFNLNKISNEQCRSCHVVKFDSFDGHHPKFENYPFKQRTRIIYDHAGHFGKHFPEVAKKDPARRIPDTCSTCHNSREDKRVMAVAPFEQTCTACHLDQIVGKERVSGPKGIAFLTLPGLDLQTLKKKNASIGEWPDASEAELTPFMKVMISRNERGRALIKTVDSLNLQDLTDASDDQIKAVTNLVWEIKGLFYALISGKASDVLADLNIGGGAKLSANLVADLTASIPRDVVISAQQQWLPNLATEMANGPDTSDPEQSGWSTVITEAKSAGSASPEELSGSDAPRGKPQAHKPKLAKQPAYPNSIRQFAPRAFLVSVCCSREAELKQSRLKQPSLKERLEKPMPRLPHPMAPHLRMRPPRRTQMRQPRLRRTQIPRRLSRIPRTQPSLKERPEKPISRTPSPMAARKRSPPANSLRARRRTKPTICSSPRRKSFARSKLIKHARKQPSLKERPATPRRTQIPRRLSLKQGLRP